MAQITGGKVNFARSVQPAQYETKKAEVELSFTFAENEPLGEFLDTVANLAQDKALEMVGLKKSAEAKPASAKATKAKPPSDAELLDASEKQKAKEAYAAKQRVGEDLEAAKAKAEAANTAKQPALDDLSLPVAETKTDPDADLLGPEQRDTYEVISDEELLGAVTRKNQEIKNPKAIHAIREKYVKLPKGLRDIEQKDRPAFLKELNALTKG